MDSRIADTIAGIDPSVIGDWQPNSNFSISSWRELEYSEYDQSLSWDAAQGPNCGDSTLFGPGGFQETMGHGTAFLIRSDEWDSIDNSHVTSPKFSLPDGTVDGTVSSTVSPKTLPSCADDSLYLDESWSEFKLLNSAAPGPPTDASLFYPFAKGTATSTGTAVADDTEDIANVQGSSHTIPTQLTCLQNMLMHRPFPLISDFVDDATVNTVSQDALDVEGSCQLPVHSQFEMDQACGFPDQSSISPASFCDPDGLPPSMTSSDTSILQVARDVTLRNNGLQYHSECSSVSGDLSGAYEFPYSGPSSDTSVLTEGRLNKGNPQHGKWGGLTDGDMSSDATHLFSATAFLRGEGLITPSASIPPPVPKILSTASQRPSARPPLAPQSVAAVRKRSARNTGVSTQSSCKPLQIVQEDGQGGAVAPLDIISPPRGARRKGPLTTAARANAGLRRKNKDTCVQCRLNKRKCDGNSPCDACRPTLHEQPCVRACFASIVEYGTCNYISQKAINHPTVDGSGRVRMDIPSEFNLNDLISLLDKRQGKFNIRASQSWGSLYVLDLGETYRFLSSLNEYNGSSRSSFLEFIDRSLAESKDRSKNWLSCVKDCDPMGNIYALLSQWNNMPSRARYSFVTESRERPMNVNNPEDHREILLAAQLSRIFCRILEVEGFRKLERDFYNIKWKQISQGTHLRFLKELGLILLSLRWRVSWWKCLGDGSAEPDPSQQHYVDRVDLLCKILYVYYISVLAKLPSWTITDIPKGIWSQYADSEKAIWDDLPTDATDGGFQRWMARGRELIAEAGAGSHGERPEAKADRE